MKLRDLWAWDLWAALLACVVCWSFLPAWLPSALAKDIYNMGITVLSVVFAVFFTVLTVIISTSDNEFVAFLKELCIYKGLIGTFRYTLGLLFVALMYSAIAFSVTAVSVTEGYKLQSRWALTAFSLLFFYALFAVMYSTSDAIEYAKRRFEFVEMRQRQEKK